MALQLGQTIARASGSGNPQVTGSITIAANDKVVVLLLKTQAALVRAGGAPTFGGLALTQASTAQIAVSSPEAAAEIWYRLDPPVGANTFSIPNTNVNLLFYTIVTVKGSSTKNGLVTLDGANGANNTSTNPSPGAVVTTTERGIGFAIAATGANSWVPTGRVGTSIADTDDGNDGGSEQYILTNSPGSTTLSWTFGTSDDWGAVAVFFKEVTPPILNNYQGVKADDGMSTGERIR